MALVLKDRVNVTTTTTGTGTLALGSTVAGYQDFSSIGSGNATYYTIVDPTGDWEVGIGTYTSPSSLSRDVVLSSSNSGSLVPFGVGTKNVFVTYPSEKSVNLNESDALALSNIAASGFKTATFNSQTTIATTSGSINIDWTTAQNQKQTEPTGTITYTFTAPPGPCHMQLVIDSDGTSTAQTINWPGTVTWLSTTWAGANNKKAVINFWYDGTNYFATGSNQA